MGPGLSLRLDELGSWQFGRFCAELLGVDLRAEGEERAPWGFSLLRPGPVELPTGGRLAGPALVLAVWLRGAAGSREAAGRLEQIVRDELARCPVPPRALLLLTSVCHVPRPPGVQAIVLGPEELWQLLRGQPRLRFRLPFLLGIVDLSQLLPNEVVQRSTADVAGAGELARVFVPTRAYAHALAVLEQHRFVVLSGPPEMGKTAVARMLGLAALSDGWELHECLRPDEFWQRFARERRQVFIADDAFGSTEYRPETAERWALELDRVLRSLDERHRLIWTSRPTPLKAALRRIHREHGVERFPRPAQVGVDAAELEVAEKALILFRHAKAAARPAAQVRLVQGYGWEVVSHPHFTPERIRRFVADRLAELAASPSGADVAAAVAAEIREPTAAMAASYRALDPEHRAVLLAMLDVPPGPVDERDLTAATRRHAPAGLARPISELVDRLADHFLRPLATGAVTWVHPSWRDLVIDELAAAAQARQAFLRVCGIHGAALALSSAGGSSGERTLPLLRTDGDWDALADRLMALLPALGPSETTLLLTTLTDAGEQRPEAAERELEALSGELLDRLARHWDASGAPTAVAHLDAWFALAGLLAESPRPPLRAIATSWIELAPSGAADLGATGIAALDEWLGCAELLRAQHPETLERLGFPDGQRAALRAAIAAAPAAARALEPAPRDLLIRSLHRLARLLPELAYEAIDAVESISAAARQPTAGPEPPLRDLSPELDRLLEQPLPSSRSDHALVTRLLRDL